MRPSGANAPDALGARPGRAAGAAVLALTALAFLLRAYHLASQSFWYDEGFSVYLAGMSLGEIITRTASDIHPPLYYLLLHGWMLAAGRNEFAVRFLSALFSSLTIPVMFQLGWRLAGQIGGTPSSTRARAQMTGVLAALLAATSPFYVWYAQETRMYSMLTFLGALSSVLLLRMLQGGDAPSRRDIAGWSVLSIAAVYTHFYAFFILAFQAVVALRIRRSPLSVKWPHPALVRAFILVILAYLPWLGVTITRLGADVSYWEGQLDAVEVISKTFAAFAAGHTAEPSEELLIGLLYAALLAWGSAAVILHARNASRSSTGASPAVFLLLYLLLPPILLYAVSVGRPKFHPRYLMLASPPFYLLVAWGLASLASVRASAGRLALFAARGASTLAACLLVMAALVPLGHYYRNEVLARDDFRSVARWIAERIAPDEAVILISGHMFPVFEYYLQGPRLIKLPDQPTLSTRETIGYGVAGALNEGVAGRPGAWLVLWQDSVVDPNGIIVSMLDQQGQSVPVTQSFWGVRLLHYALPPTARFSSVPAMQAVLDMTFADQLRLLGYRVASPTAYPGEALTLTVYWQALKPLTDDYQIVLRLVDAAGNVCGSYEGRPAAYQHPTFRWNPGDTVPGTVAVSLLPGTPPGEYSLNIGVYPVGAGSRLEARGPGGGPLGQAPRLGTIAVAPARQPPDRSAVDRLIRNRVDRKLAPDLLLVGHNLQPAEARPGDLVPITMVWQATAVPAGDYALRLLLTDAAGQTAGARSLALTPADYATSRWRPGEVIASRLTYLLPASTPAGSWTLQAEVTLAGSPAGERIVLAPITVTARSALPPVGRIEHAVEVSFSEGILLRGYSVRRATGGLEATLFWSSEAEIERQYTVFVHVLDTAGAIVSQDDSAPAGGVWPTTAWLPGTVLPDTHTVTMTLLPTPTQVRLAIGLYEASTGRRLKLAGSADDRVVLGPVEVP